MCLQGDIGCPLCWRGTCHTFQLMAWKPRPVDHKAGARNSRRRDECVMANKSVTIFIASRIRKNRPCRCPTRCSKSAERRPCGAKCTSAFQINSSRVQWQCIADQQTEALCRFASASSPSLGEHCSASDFLDSTAGTATFHRTVARADSFNCRLRKDTAWRCSEICLWNT